jgi:rSAM/selenodomain-associated transferase 2
MQSISVIIPTLNEERLIKDLVNFIWDHGEGQVKEVIVVDAQSTDQTVSIAEGCRAIIIHSAKRSRACQMNLGASVARGDILYFVHADGKLLPSFVKDICQALSNGYSAGCYRFRFDLNKGMLRINSFCTRFGGIMCRGGDQTLFITKELFGEIGGYNEYFTIMEDYDLIGRIRREHKFRIIPKSIIVSARKYEANSWLRVQAANFIVFTMYFLKRKPEEIKVWYEQLLKSLS